MLSKDLGQVRLPLSPGGAIITWPGDLQTITLEPTIMYINAPVDEQTDT